MNVYIIYKLTFPNDKIYIGQTKQKFNSYMLQYKSKSINKKSKDYNRLLYKAIRKYGWDNIKKEILLTTSEEFVDELETKMIDEYKSADRKFGYNILEIGESRKGHKHTKKTKNKIRLSHLGKRHTEKSKQLIREAKLGKKHSDETKEKMRKAKLGKNHPMWKKSQSKEHVEKRNKKVQKSVIAHIKKTDKCVGTFESVKQAGITLNINKSHISNVLHNKRKSISGYIFKYA